MDVKLQNIYSQVLLDNFVAVIKQNVLFQSQLELNKNDIEAVGEQVRRVQELSSRNEELQKSLIEKDLLIKTLTTERNDLRNTVNSKDSQVTNLNVIVQEKNRLQNAVNDYMRQLEESRKEILKIRSESQEALVNNNKLIDDLNKYIGRLESVVPAAKLKKVRLGENVQPESPESVVIEENDLVKSGGTF